MQSEIKDPRVTLWKNISGAKCTVPFKKLSQDLTLKTEQLIYMNPNFCYPDNDGCSHNIGGFVSIKKKSYSVCV